MTATTLRGVTLPDGTSLDLHLSDGFIVDDAPSGATVSLPSTGVVTVPFWATAAVSG